MNIDQARSICRQFDIGEPASVRAAGGTRNRNYIVETDRGRWFCRSCHPAYSQEERLRFDFEAAQFLHLRGVAVPAPRSNLAGSPWQRDGDSVWQVMPFVAGHHLRDGDERDNEGLGVALAAWHRAGRDFPLRLRKAAARAETDPLHLVRAADAIEAEDPGSGSSLAPYRAAIRAAAAALPDADYTALPHTLIHGDIQPANILVSDERVAAFVDLDWCGWQARLYDLCNAILFCCARHASPFDGGDIASLTQPPILEPGPVSAFLNSYQREADPLDRSEWTALRPQLLLTWCHTRLNGALKVAVERRPQFLDRPPDLRTEPWQALSVLERMG